MNLSEESDHPFIKETNDSEFQSTFINMIKLIKDHDATIGWIAEVIAVKDEKGRTYRIKRDLLLTDPFIVHGSVVEKKTITTGRLL